VGIDLRTIGAWARRGLPVGLAAGLLPAPALGAPALRVIPFPGTPDASASTQVIFSALRASQLRSVTVFGSRSGGHDGRLEALPAGAGTAFVPARPFAPGETVRVSAVLSSPRAGTASGERGATRLSFPFRVAPPVGPFGAHIARPQNGDLQAPPWRTTRHVPTQSFHSEPDLHPPVVTVSTDPDRTSGDIFMTPENSPQVGPMILSSSGQLIWFDPLPKGSPDNLTGNLAVQRYRGRPVLTWWQGRATDGVVQGPAADVIMNRSYRKVAVVRAGNGYLADLHEFQITPQDTAYLESTVVTQSDLSSVGGPSSARVMDNVIQEIDIRTGKVLWEWHALGHVPVNASYLPYSPQEGWYDYFHLNSIQQLPSGNLLVSARDTWAVYEISRRTGKVIWTLGGRYSDFKMGRGTRFEWQHDARLRGNTLTLLDDAANPQEEPESSAKYLKINLKGRTVSLISRLTHFPPVLASAGGSVQTLPNGNVFVGWGSVPQFSEFTAAGRQIFNGSLALGLASYRAFRFPWVGEPSRRPSLAVSPGPDGHLKVYASWNGATAVTDWRVLGGRRPHDLRPLGLTSPSSGFETAIDVSSEPPYLAVQALGRKGGVLSTSAARADPPHLALFGPSLFVSASGGAEVPVGCLGEGDCRVTVTIRSRGSVLARSQRRVVRARRAGLVPVRLSASGQRELENAPHHRLQVQVIVRPSSGLPVARRDMILIPYRATGPSRPGPRSSSPGVQIVGAMGFASSTGRARILTACYASSRCHFVAELSAGGHLIGRTARRVDLGADELGYTELQLDRAGRALLARSSGHRLPVRVRLRADGHSRTAEIDLVAYE
jgi:Arylsulfotransferase (ASST)